EAAVIARQDERAEKYLVAYVVPQEEQKITFSELRSFLKEHLPDYMVPTDFVLLDAMPLTPNGKVDQRALPAPQRGRSMTEEIFVAPTSLVHHQLVQIWEELLETRPIGMRDNFFQLGGHSLLAARLVQRIEQVCGKKISLATLFAGPTIEQLTDAFQCQEDKGSRTPVVGVQTDGSRRPFFFLHGDWTGGAFYCFALARALEADQPFYVLEPYRLEQQEIPPTLEAMATAHLEALRAIQPEGPYLLAGFCNGGLLAYEIARQLHAEGQKVDLLFLINPTPPARYNFLRDVVSRFANVIKLSQDQQADCFLRLRHMLRHVYRYLHSSNDRRLADFEKLLSVDARLDSMFPATEALRKDFVGVFTWLGSGYQPGFYPGKVMRFWSREDAILEAVWRRLAPAKEVEDHIIPGTHMSCVTTHTRDLAQLLSAYLSEVQ
ncbi:MAG: thioesterase domain-containing protein, partial [Ktedonobacteraceae bacterium]